MQGTKAAVISLNSLECADLSALSILTNEYGEKNGY
jgi:hypothetical protein